MSTEQKEQIKAEDSIPENGLIRRLKSIQVKANEKIATDKIIEDSKHLFLETEDKDLKTLEFLGLDHFHRYEKQLKEDVIRTKRSKEIYAKESFTGAEVKALCLEYDLRILGTRLYNGLIPTDLARIVQEFSAKHKDVSMSNFFILAPEEMFNTIKHVPQKLDPILFFVPDTTHSNSISEQSTCIAVHDWGNDFTAIRKIKWFFNGYVHNAEHVSNKTRSLLISVVLVLTIFASLFVTGPPAIFTLIVLAAIPIYFFVSANIRYKKNYLIDLWNTNKC